MMAPAPTELFAVRSAAHVAADIADVRTAGIPAAAPGGHGTEYGTVIPTISTVAEAQPFVEQRRAEGSDYLKISLNGVRVGVNSQVSNLDEPRVRALVDAAHANDMLAVAHVETVDDAKVALAGGIDGLMHVWRRGGASPDVARRIASQGVFVVPTLAVFDGLFRPEGRAGLLSDHRFLPFLSVSMRTHLTTSFTPSLIPSQQRLQTNLDVLAAVRSLHDAGVTLLVGTDAASILPTAHGISVHRELELLSQSGLSPSEVLAAATSRTADAFRMIDRGRLVAGRRADMLLVRGDPTVDVLAVRDIIRIWKAGVEVDRAVGDR
jgi:imidazolonepropionase-like amidohydrolase